jgi:hypothetical protein
LKYFNKYTPLIGSHRLFILNNYGSYTIFGFVNYAEQNNIILFYLSVCSTHRFQLLDIEIFGLLLTIYSQLINKYNKYEGMNVIKREWIKWILLIRAKANTKSNIRSAWIVTELISFDFNKILKILKTVCWIEMSRAYQELKDSSRWC